MTKYNHLLDIGFTVITEHESWLEIPIDEILAGLEARIKYLREHPDEIDSSVGFCDTYEIEDE